MILDDLVFVGRTVPEKTSDGRTVVCSAGFSADFGGLLRLYPLPPWGHPHRWDVCRVEVEADRRHDSRPESYKVKADRQDLPAVADAIHKVDVLPKTARLDWLDHCRAKSIKELDDRKRSLGVIAPTDLSYSFEYDRAADDAMLQLPGFESERPEHGRRSFPKRPRLRYRCGDSACRCVGEPHDHALNGWDAYEWVRKNPGNEAQLFNPNHPGMWFGAPDRDVRLLVGNHLHHRNAWLVIAFLSFEKAQPSLFDQSKTEAAA